MNSYSLLLILLGLAFIVTLQLALSWRDEKFHQQLAIARLARENKELRTRNYRLITEATTLNGERDYLARRNVVLEASFRYRKECLAGAMLRKQLVNVDAKLRLVERISP